MTTETEDRLAGARDQAKAQMESIANMVMRLRLAEAVEYGNGNPENEDFDDTYKALAEEDGHYEIRETTGDDPRFYWRKKGDGAPYDDASDEAYDTEPEAWRACCTDNDLIPSVEDAHDRITEDALSVEVRSGWYNPGSLDSGPEEFMILLCTGGPAVRIIGDLDRGSPSRPRLECQDWFTPWTEVFDVDRDVLQTYCEQFYFGGR